MIVIDGIQLEDRHSWIRARTRLGLKGKVAEGVIFLVSIQNAETRFSAWQKMVKALNSLPEKVVFCENDSTDKTLELINRWDFPHELISFKSKKEERKDLYTVIAKNRQHLLERARELNPNFAIYLDDDVFPEDINLIKKLTRHRLPLVGGAYLRPFEDKGWFVASKWEIDTPLKELPQALELKSLVDNAKKEDYRYLMFTSCHRKLYKVMVTSAGCLCLNRKIIQDTRLNFYPIRHDLGGEEEISEDFGFCLLARHYGYEVCLDGDVRLTHLIPPPDKVRPWIVRRR